jgi:transcriptional regulator with XRE-family HTH domain
MDERLLTDSLANRILYTNIVSHMESLKLTCVAVLRTKLGRTVEQFARLIDKSVSTIHSLESGRLALSQETAIRIEEETGVSMQWLLGNNPSDEPFWINRENQRMPWGKSMFELIQSDNLPSGLKPAKPGWRLPNAITVVGDWLSIYSAADQKGQGSRATYLMRQFLEKLNEALGKDDEAFVRANQRARLIAQDNSEWKFVFDNYADQIQLQRCPRE